ncbi:hypothetical protein NQ318_012665 [Aromia moschata]|uniref:Transposase n=1 Tax=Aromia moschata TaxID=1265417 RepID=A0AAV8YJI1_9CUCU|nr:hypothetical protein NQ318_012665 [Aromia moschata]
MILFPTLSSLDKPVCRSTVSRHYYIEVLTALRERVRRRRPDLWTKTKSWKIHQDNALAHSALPVKAFFAKYDITVLEYPPHSSNLALCDFFKGTRFESVEAVKAKATEVLNQLREADFQHCFRQWRSRMEGYRDRQGEYIEGEKVATDKNTHAPLSDTLYVVAE